MSPNLITATIYEKLVFLFSFRVDDSFTPEEQWLAKTEYIKAINYSQIFCIELDPSFILYKTGIALPLVAYVDDMFFSKRISVM